MILACTGEKNRTICVKENIFPFVISTLLENRDVARHSDGALPLPPAYLLVHCCFLDMPDTLPLSPQAPGLWKPQLRPVTRPRSLDIFSLLLVWPIFWVASCLLFPFPKQDLTHQSGAQLGFPWLRVEIPASIQFLLDKWVWLLVVVLLF